MSDSIAAACCGEPERTGETTAACDFCFAAEDPTFAGHFPGRPMLPGVFQLEMVRVVAERVWGGRWEVLEVSRAKWLRPIQPGERVRLELEWTPDAEGMRLNGRVSVQGEPAGDVRMKLCRSRNDSEPGSSAAP